MVPPSRQQVEELDGSPPGTHPPLPPASLGWCDVGSLAEGLLPHEVLSQPFLVPTNAMVGEHPPSQSRALSTTPLCSPDLTLNSVFAGGRLAGLEPVGLLWGKPARAAVSFFSSQQWVSAGAALSCPTTCPGQGDVLSPFLEVGQTGFLEEGRQDKPCVRCTRGGRREPSWGERMGRSGAPGWQWKNRFARILGRTQDSKALSVFVSQSLALPRPQGTGLSRALNLSTCSSHSSPARDGTPGCILQMEKLRPREEESHAQIQKG